MSQTFLQFATALHRLTMAICLACLLVVLVSMSANVLLRHGAGFGFLKLQDLTLFAFGIFAILAIPCALAEARHVRVEAGGEHESRRTLSALSGLGTMLLLFIASTLLFHGWPLFINSLTILEGSGQIGGLGGFFIVKAALPLGAILIFIQGIALWMRGGEAKG